MLAYSGGASSGVLLRLLTDVRLGECCFCSIRLRLVICFYHKISVLQSGRKFVKN